MAVPSYLSSRTRPLNGEGPLPSGSVVPDRSRRSEVSLPLLVIGEAGVFGCWPLLLLPLLLPAASALPSICTCILNWAKGPGVSLFQAMPQLFTTLISEKLRFEA